jgi:hypothetical protein
VVTIEPDRPPPIRAAHRSQRFMVSTDCMRPLSGSHSAPVTRRPRYLWLSAGPHRLVAMHGQRRAPVSARVPCRPGRWRGSGGGGGIGPHPGRALGRGLAALQVALLRTVSAAVLRTVPAARELWDIWRPWRVAPLCWRGAAGVPWRWTSGSPVGPASAATGSSGLCSGPRRHGLGWRRCTGYSGRPHPTRRRWRHWMPWGWMRQSTPGTWRR